MRRSLKIVCSGQGGNNLKSNSFEEKLATTHRPSPPVISLTKREESTLNTINELVRTISHYLNSPLTVLLGKVELLSEASENGGMSKEDLKKSLDTCKKEIFRIDAIIKSFQGLCRVQHKSYPPGVRMLDVEREIKDRLRHISFLR